MGQFLRILRNCSIEDDYRPEEDLLYSLTGLRVMAFLALNLTDCRGDYETVLLCKERSWLFSLGTLQRKGLNNELSLRVLLEP